MPPLARPAFKVPDSLVRVTGVGPRGIARIAAGKAVVPRELAEPLRRAAILIGNLRTVVAEHEVDPHVLRADLLRVLLERSLYRIFEPTEASRSLKHIRLRRAV